MVAAVLRVVEPAPAPSNVAPEPAATGPLTRHLLLVVVDGLRYDVATDPEQMPHFAAAMRRHSSGEIWAGRVSMTTSAVMTYATGQPGRLEQVIRNANPGPPPFNTWLENAKAQGLQLAAVGDPAWMQMFGAHFDDVRPDPKGVAIDVDFNAQTFADVRALLAARPSFLVAHFVTPDHQGHAYGIRSERYRQHIRGYDADLAALLSELGPEWTVIVTSDHGAADSGTHGTDTPVQRRSPIYAYGPGIAPGVRPREPLDQADLAGTMAALLGAPAAAHGRGHLLVDWLDLTPAERAELACQDAARVERYAQAVLGPASAGSSTNACAADASPSSRVAAARASVRRWDAALEGAIGLTSSTSWIGLALLVLLAVAGAALALGRRFRDGLLPAAAAAGIGLALVFWIERLPGHSPNIVRGLLFVAANLGVLYLLLWPGRAGAWLERRPALAPSLVPGALVASYTSTTQPESYVAVAVLSLVFALRGPLLPGREPLWRTAALRASPAQLALLGLLVAVLFRPGTRQQDVYPSFFFEQPALLLALDSAALAGWVVLSGRGLERSRRFVGMLAAAFTIIGSLWLRRVASPELGRAALLLLPTLALVAVLRQRPVLGLYLGVAGYMWVSRDREILPLIATVGIAQIVGRLSAPRQREGGSGAVGLGHTLGVCAFVFGLLFVQRIGIQGHLDLGSMDWGAGGFGDPHVPAWLVGSALTWKYVLAELLVLGALMAPTPPPLRERLLPALLVMYLARGALLLTMLFVCGNSFWTALRVTSDLPFGPTGAVAVGLCWCISRALERQRAVEPQKVQEPPLPRAA